MCFAYGVRQAIWLEFGEAQWLLDGVVGPGIGSADTVPDSQTLGLAEDFDIS